MTLSYENWVGRQEERTEQLLSSAVQAMAATLDWPQAPAQGQALPPGWQWMFFNPVARQSALGSDGHPARGGFLPPIDLPRRMWAGSRIQYLADLPVGSNAARRSQIQKIESKSGKRGALWFVTVAHSTFSGDQLCVVEEQDIVYREATPPGAPALVPQAYEGQAQWGREVMPDPTLLFRYSALTFNGHRIHYDQAYATGEEGYPDLVVHGPLTATLLQQLAVEQGGGKSLARFEFRGVSPLFVNRAFRVEGRRDEDGSLALWARGPNGELAMSASATFR